MIRFKMFRISVEQFAILADNMFSNDFIVNTTLGMDFSLTDRNIRIRMGFSFLQDEKKVVLLNVACEFNIHEEDWGSVVQGDKYVYPKYLIDCLLAQVVGTARGILHCKTEGTNFNTIIIPAIDVTKMTESDVVIDKTTEGA